MRQSRSTRRRLVRAVAAGLAVCAVAIALGAAALRRGQAVPPAGASGRTNVFPAPQDTRAVTALALWREQALQAGVPARAGDLVARLLKECTPLAEQELEADVAPRLRTSLRPFLGQFLADFQGEQTREGICYWTAWLMAEALQRPPLSAEAKEAVRRDFEAFVDEAVAVVRSRFQETLGQREYAKYSQPIQTCLDWLRAQLLGSFTPLHNDVLFPVLKSALTQRQRREVFRSLRSTALPTPSAPPRMMELSEEVFLQRLRLFFRTIPQAEVLPIVAFEGMYPALVRNDYWGAMGYRATGSKGAWPIVVWCTPWERPTERERGAEDAPGAR